MMSQTPTEVLSLTVFLGEASECVPMRATTKVPAPHPLNPRPYNDHEAAPAGLGVLGRVGAVVEGSGDPAASGGRCRKRLPWRGSDKDGQPARAFLDISFPQLTYCYLYPKDVKKLQNRVAGRPPLLPCSRDR